MGEVSAVPLAEVFGRNRFFLKGGVFMKKLMISVASLLLGAFFFVGLSAAGEEDVIKAILEARTEVKTFTSSFNNAARPDFGKGIRPAK